jgi:DNA-binding response OmpR family regulator
MRNTLASTKENSMTDEHHAPVILYVEDEERIREAMIPELEKAGFELLIAHDGNEALDILAEDKGIIDGLLTDVKLNDGPTGWNVARRARRRTPSMPVMYASSAEEKEWLVDGVPRSTLVRKPFRPSQITDGLRSILSLSKQRLRSTFSARKHRI